MLTKAIFQLFRPFNPTRVVRITHQRFSFNGPRFYYSTNIRDLPIFVKLSQGGSQEEFTDALNQLKDFTSEQRDQGLRLLIENIGNHKLPFSSLQNQQFQELLSPYPKRVVQASIYQIKLLMKSLHEASQRNQIEEINQTFQKLDSKFTQSFKQLQSITSDSVEEEISLNKIHADYLMLYQADWVHSSKKIEVLERSCNVYKHLLETIVTYAVETFLVYEKRSLQEKTSQIQAEISIVKEKYFKIIETYSEIINKVAKIQQNIEMAQPQNNLQQSQFHMLPELKNAIHLYSKIPSLTATSQYYHKLKMMLLEESYLSELVKFQNENDNPQEIVEFDNKISQKLGEQMEEFYDEINRDLSIILNQPYNLRYVQELVVLMLGIRAYTWKELLHKKELFVSMISKDLALVIEEMESAEDKKAIYDIRDSFLEQLLAEENQTNTSN